MMIKVSKVGRYLDFLSNLDLSTKYRTRNGGHGGDYDRDMDIVSKNLILESIHVHVRAIHMVSDYVMTSCIFYSNHLCAYSPVSPPKQVIDNPHLLSLMIYRDRIFNLLEVL